MVELIIIGAYMLSGIVALAVLDMRTGRVRNRLKPASYETQEKLVVAGSFVGTKTAMALTLAVLWILWPVAIYAAISNRGGNK